MELGSQQIARQALRELLLAFPQDWQTALANSFPDRQLRNWLFILPANHSLVGIYPLVFATLLGLRVLVKRPPNLDYLRHFIAFLKRYNSGITSTTLSHTDLRIPTHIDAILCYGSDDTVAALRQNTSKPVVGFGSHDTVTVTSLDHLQRFPHLYIRDAFHLAQRGCLSSKMLFLVPRATQNLTAANVRMLEENFHTFAKIKLSTAAQLHVAAERVRYLRSLGAVFCSTGYPAFPILPLTTLDFDAALPRTTFVLPLVIVRDTAALKHLLRHHPNIKTIVQPGSPAQRQYHQGRCFIRPGHAGHLMWNGTHENQPLFAARVTTPRPTAASSPTLPA